MRRRDALRAIVAAATGGSVMQVRADAAPPAVMAAPPRRRPRLPFIGCADGTNLFYRDWGVGRPVVFVAPWALTADWWDHQVAYLSQNGLRCVAYDRRGHGRSSEPGGGYDFDTLADDLAALIRQLDLRDITLVGHSVGAAEVVRYLARHGARRVARAVLIAPITPLIVRTADNPNGADPRALEQGRELLMKEGPQRLADAAPAFFNASANAVSAETMAWWVRMIADRSSLSVKLALHRTFTETDFRADLHKITTPTLVIHGDSDVSARIDLTGRPTHHLIRGSVLNVYERAGHGLPITHADRLHGDILAFIAEPANTAE